MKKVIKYFFIVIVLVYFTLFYSYSNGYYRMLSQKKTALTEEMILKYEEDLKNGLDVTKEDYNIKGNDYSNGYTKITLKVSKKIEKMLDGGIKYIFRKLNGLVQD